MSETFRPLSQEEILKDLLEKKVRSLEGAIDEANTAMEAGDREKAKKYLPAIYDGLIALNKRDKGDWTTLFVWNPDGALNQEDFDRLDLRRKQVSNAIGTMTSSGVVRHDVHEI